MATRRADVPDPRSARTETEFVDALRALKDRSRLTYRMLAERAEARGDVLPRSTLANALTRDAVPREDVVAALVRACGCDEDVVGEWLEARRRVVSVAAERDSEAAEAPAATAPAVGATAVGATATQTPAGSFRSARTRSGGFLARAGRMRGVRWAAAALVLGVLVAGTVLSALVRGGGEDRRSADRLPPEGRVTVRAAHSGLCLTEGRERNKRSDRPLAVQNDCERAAASPPVTLLERVDDGIYRLKWSHPEHGTGCLAVDEGGTHDGYLIAPQSCTEDQPAQRFLVEPVDSPAEDGFRLRPLHSGKCVGFVDPAKAPGAELVQSSCTDSAEQEFFITARPDGAE
ncbi:helix-turn-helix domain-containing protein [Streptomyces sp. NBC_00872]|uniref:helix-turn-helix domain-containing protein n=1 Tax=Streptomyces sp. NBC_00872 TaxID=2903686 RepID=UPI003867F264|nr:XRE family transcriptional regulator [Streptomyces sp. NBC_00872]